KYRSRPCTSAASSRSASCPGRPWKSRRRGHGSHWPDKNEPPVVPCGLPGAFRFISGLARGGPCYATEPCYETARNATRSGDAPKARPGSDGPDLEDAADPFQQLHGLYRLAVVGSGAEQPGPIWIGDAQLRDNDDGDCGQLGKALACLQERPAVPLRQE